MRLAGAHVSHSPSSYPGHPVHSHQGSDVMGRITAFNATLFFTAVFGLLSSFSNSFSTLCISLFFLGSSVGVSHFKRRPFCLLNPFVQGSMPTDGTLLLEHMPKEKQYLVTALSFFFSVGAALSAVVALLVIPQNSCPPSTLVHCDVDVQNQGWKYLVITLGLIVRTQNVILVHREPTHQSLRHSYLHFLHRL